jgi:hypothetical protein
MFNDRNPVSLWKLTARQIGLLSVLLLALVGSHERTTR